jgi:hypothetical protein
MKDEDLLGAAEVLEARILEQNSRGRLAMRPEFDNVVARLRRNGGTVPGRLRRLEVALRQEAIEEMFDNMPV